MMEPKDVPAPAWVNLLSKNYLYDLEFLALKILLTRLKREINLNPTPEQLNKSAQELQLMFIKCWSIPKVRKDFINMISKEGLS